jgi:hypothetical protein
MSENPLRRSIHLRRRLRAVQRRHEHLHIIGVIVGIVDADAARSDVIERAMPALKKEDWLVLRSSWMVVGWHQPAKRSAWIAHTQGPTQGAPFRFRPQMRWRHRCNGMGIQTVRG